LQGPVQQTLFSALYGTYTVALQELKALLKASSTIAGKSKQKAAKQPTQEEVFQGFGVANDTAATMLPELQRNQW
jgi:hypothetical protein